MCLGIGTIIFLLDIRLTACAHQIGGAGFGIGRGGGGRCGAIAGRCAAQCDAIAKHTQIGAVAHAAMVCGIVGGALQTFDKLAPAHNRFARVQPHR